ncbi:Na+/H+ antiporter subunit E [Deinococcus metallilatus]|uniref:Multicomponent Na+:H+ antiporter subunit E n=1 Tax=Deinococcus metallilatus TaxID=1211322 RepID=A0AAJ5F240_9DEIO|nr:Na+/H+ antiporter subunit E [Deinococcus metallilatus]MBB5296857.1 multicomponent Na+:H+ antiporter subunit E [Deinococcus metallilatus]QBY09590.1 Na+/H+ antiporter subunit E [Deinococcus metallilatus]RXJ09194.1 Na+/H+ antiporter subunit E [Deinococcus metallilatus]TLK22762.1 Na+/H+ antiporter subunit E [Deinococcus metallilatus]GMA13891.1 Na+/H+ antiporter subunit E [Deinococcus metallilatus]
MNGFTLNLLLAVVWMLFVGEVSLRELVVGFLLGFGILAVFPRALGSGGYVGRSLAVLGFVGFFLRELTVANVHMALLALRPHPRLNPMIVAVPLRLQGDVAQTLLAAVIALMPGTVAMGFSADRRTLYAHAIGSATPQAARDSITRVEDRLLRVTSPQPLSEEPA